MNAPYSPIADKTSALLDTAAHGAKRVVDGVDHAARPSIDAMASGVDQLRANAVPALHELAVGAEDLARSGALAVRERALHLREASAGYVRGHPLQSVLIAAGAGAALVLLARLLSHRSGPAH